MAVITTYKKIKLGKNDYVELYGDVHLNSAAQLKAGRLEGCKQASQDLKDALNAFMRTCHEVGNLGDSWLDEIGKFSWVSGVSFVEDDDGVGLVITAQLRKDYGNGTKAIVFNSPLIKSSELTVQESMAVNELQKQIRAYVSSLPTQGEIPLETGASKA
ncbi:MAG: hypothetical protein ACFB2W_00975 [Leptolyngbyaceae cyanobacterium]